MSVTGNQRNATRNQSTVDFERKNIFLFGNRYQGGIFKNDSGANLLAEDGILVVRDKTTPGQILPATDANLADVIGILKMNGTVDLIDAATTTANYCIQGDIDGGLLLLPATVTLDTVVGEKFLRDILTDLGFVLFNVTENSKFDN